MHYQAHPLLTNFVSWRINTRKHWLSIAEKQHNINPFDAYPLTKLLFWGLSLLTCESVVNTCAVFLLCPLSVAVTYPNVLGWMLSRTTQQTLLISWEVTSSCENTQKNVWKIVCFCSSKMYLFILGTAICQEALSLFFWATSFFGYYCSTIWNASILCKTS